tara:strand:- start:3964 stop:4437 length:474 start_codon:yes stop_codon:yes gene_type:complete
MEAIKGVSKSFAESLTSDITNMQSEMKQTKNYFLVAFILIAWILLFAEKGPEYHIGIGLWVNILLILIIYHKSNIRILIYLVSFLLAYVVMYLTNVYVGEKNERKHSPYIVMVVSSLPCLWSIINARPNEGFGSYRSISMIFFIASWLYLIFLGTDE